MANKDWQGNPAHPVDNYIFFKRFAEYKAMMAPMFDSLTQGDPEKVKTLTELMDLACWNMLTQDAFNRSGADQ